MIFKSARTLAFSAPLCLALTACGNPQDSAYDAKLAQATQAADRALAAQVAAEKSAQRAEAAANAHAGVPQGPGELNPDNDPAPPEPAPDVNTDQH
ncbi:MAG: hypothetical protein ABI673_03835 [Novosphingobium sp.]